MNKLAQEVQAARDDETSKHNTLMAKHELYLASKERYLTAYKRLLQSQQKHMAKNTELIAMKDNMAALRLEYAVTQQQEMAAFVMQQVDAAIRERDANGKAAEVADVSDIKDEEMIQ